MLFSEQSEKGDGLVPTIIVCLIAGICASGFVTIWFMTAYRELWAKRSSLADLREQMCLHERLLSQARDGLETRSAARMLETSRMLCQEAAKSYNVVLHKPMNRIPALFLGFRDAEESQCTDSGREA